MKKRFLSLLMAACLMLTLAPAAFAVDGTMDESTFRSAVAAGGTVTMTGNVTLTTPLTISNAVTINGNGYTITYTPSTQTYALDIQTNGAVKFQDVTIDATAGDMTNGISVGNCIPNLTLDNTTLNVKRWGIAFNPAGNNAKLNILNNSVIQNKRVSNYETEAAYGDYRGISLWDAKQAEINVSDSTIQGFGYTINLAGTLVNNVRNFEGTNINVTNSKLMGWTAFNVWSSDTIFNITNSYLKGINNSNGYWDGFATIVVNDDIYNNGWGGADANIFNIYGGTITCYRSGATSEQLFRVDNQGITDVYFYKYGRNTNVAIIDGTGDSEAVFYSGYEKTPDDWTDYMNEHVHGSENCTLTGYNGATLAFIPD